MPSLTNRQRNLLNLINQLSQNTSTVLESRPGFEVDFPSVDFNIDLGGISTTPSTGTPPAGDDPTVPTTPTTMRELLMTLVNEQIEVATPFGNVAGLLLAVRDDYIVLVEDGAQVLVRMEAIELVSEQ